MSTKTKLLGMFVSGLAMGGVLGARLEYMTVSARRTREVLREYQKLKDTFDMTDAELVANAKKVPQFFEDEKQQDRMAAVFSLGTFKLIAAGKTDDAKAHTLIPIGMYYRIYHDKGGDPQVIGAIDEAAKEYREIAAEIAKK